MFTIKAELTAEKRPAYTNNQSKKIFEIHRLHIHKYKETIKICIMPLKEALVLLLGNSFIHHPESRLVVFSGACKKV